MRRISELLPPSMLAEMGVLPEELDGTDPPITCQRIARVIEEDPAPKDVDMDEDWLPRFEIAVSNGHVIAFSSHPVDIESHGVVVRHKSFLRYGKVTRKIMKTERLLTEAQIVMVDEDGSLGREIIFQTDRARKIAEQHGLDELEIVSDRARALLRIKVGDMKRSEVELLVHQLIPVTGIAVEVY